MTDVVHRRCVKTEWSEVPSSAGGGTSTPAPPAGGTSTIKHSSMVNNVVGASFAAIDKKAVLVGGVNPRTGRTIHQSLEFDIVTKQWSNLNAWFPVPVSDAAMVACGNTLVLFGGWNDEVLLGDLWMVTNKVDEGGVVHVGQWRRAAEEGAPSPRRGHCMVATPQREDGGYSVYMFGGFDGCTRLNDLWELDVTADGAAASWKQLDGSGERPSPRDACAFAYDAVQKRLVVFGGFTVSLDMELYTYDLPGDDTSHGKWTKLSFSVGPSRRQHCFGVCHQQYFLSMFGHDGKQTLSQMCQLSLQEGKWTMIVFDGDEVEPRLAPAMCIAEGGKKVLVFGGQSKGKYLSSILELELEKCEAAAPVKGGKK